MKRHLQIGRWSRDLARVIPIHACIGDCNQGRECTCDTELANTVPPREQLVRSVPTRPPFQITGGRIPLRRRVRRFMRALWDFLTAPCFRP